MSASALKRRARLTIAFGVLFASIAVLIGACRTPPASDTVSVYLPPPPKSDGAVSVETPVDVEARTPCVHVELSEIYPDASAFREPPIGKDCLLVFDDGGVPPLSPVGHVCGPIGESPVVAEQRALAMRGQLDRETWVWWAIGRYGGWECAQHEVCEKNPPRDPCAISAALRLRAQETLRREQALCETLRKTAKISPYRCPLR